MPITWRNVNSTVTGGGGGSNLDGAQRSFDSGFEALQKTLQQRQTTQDQNWNTRSDNNTQDFMNLMSQYRTPEEFQAAMADGSIQQAFQGHGRQIDQDAARTAMDNRLGVLQQRQTQTNEYGDAAQRRGNRGLRGDITNLVLDGKIDQANALFDANQDAFVDPSAVRRELFGDEKSRRGEDRAQAGETRAQAGELRAQENQSDLRGERALRDSTRESAKIADDLMSQNLEALDRRTAGTSQALGEIGRNLDLPLTPNGNVDTNNLTPEQRERFETAVNEAGIRGIPSDTEMVGQYRAQLQQEGKYSPNEIAQLTNQFDAHLAQRGQLSTRGRQREADALAQVDAQYEALAANNPFYTPAQNVFEATTRILSDIKDPKKFDPIGSNKKERREFATAVADSMNEGIEIGGERIPLRPEFVDRVVLEFADINWNLINTVGSLYQDRVREILENDPFQLQQLRDAQVLDQEKVVKESQVRRTVREEEGQQGVPVDNMMREINRRESR